jgi:hypothetical protein
MLSSIAVSPESTVRVAAGAAFLASLRVQCNTDYILTFRFVKVSGSTLNNFFVKGNFQLEIAGSHPLPGRDVALHPQTQHYHLADSESSSQRS